MSAEPDASTSEQPWRAKHNPWAIALTVTIATFMEVLDTSIANVSLPSIAGSLSASQEQSTWVLSSYLVANAVVLPMSAWIADRVGRKRFYMSCVVLFTLSSLLCGLAPNLGCLIFFRVLQGIGGGGLAPSEQSILADTFEPAKRGVAFAVYGMAVVFAPAIGPTLGGYITDHFSWHWIFFINVPVGIGSLFLTHHFVEDPPTMEATKAKSKNARIDFLGAGLIAIGFGSLEVVLDKGQEDDWFQSSFIITFAVISVVALAFFIVWELQQKDPILDLRLFKNRNFAAVNLLMFALGIVLFGTTILIPEFLQTQLGYTAELAGKVLTPGGFTIMLCMPIVGRLISKVDPRYLIGFGFIASGLALQHMTNIYLGADFHTMVLYRIFQMVGIAFLFVPINTTSYTGIPSEKNGQVSAMTNLCRNLGGSVGIAIVSTMLARQAQTHQTYLSEHLSPSNPAFSAALSALTQPLIHSGSSAVDAMQQAYAQLYRILIQQSTVLAYIDTISLLAACCLLALPLVLLLKKKPPNAPAAMGH